MCRSRGKKKVCVVVVGKKKEFRFGFWLLFSLRQPATNHRLLPGKTAITLLGAAIVLETDAE